MCLEIEKKHRLTDAEARNIIKQKYNMANARDLQKLEITARNGILKELKEKCGLSIRQIERLTGINRGVVTRV